MHGSGHTSPTIDVGIEPALAPGAGGEDFHAFIQRLIEDVKPALDAASGACWNFHIGKAAQLDSDSGRRAPDFLPEATHRLAEGSFDLIVVVMDAPLISASDQAISGLASPITRTCVLSANKLRMRGKGVRLPLDSEALRWNGAALLLHLIGHVLGLKHRKGGDDVMSPFAFEENRRALPRFADPERLRRLAARFPEPEYRTGTWLKELWLHISIAVRHPATILAGLWRNRAPLLPLKMPGLATAAVAPTILLVFTAEFWDAGLGMSNRTALVYALISIAGATLYLSFVQNLFLPRREQNVVTEHLAVANVMIFLTMLLAMIGLFFMVALLMLALELWVFPQGLIATWPTLHEPDVTLADKFRLASFISTVGVTTGALAGGLERQNVLRNLAFFRQEV